MHLKYKTKNQKSYVYLLLTLVKFKFDFCESFVPFVVMFWYNIFVLGLLVMKLFFNHVLTINGFTISVYSIQ